MVTGDRGVGKTALVLRYAKGIFNFAYAATVGVEFYSKNKSHDNEAYTLNKHPLETISHQRVRTQICFSVYCADENRCVRGVGLDL